MVVMVVSLHVAVCILLIMVVLLQAGKGSGMGSALGSSSQAFLDGDSATSVLGKATTIAAIVFMLTSLTMGYLNARGPVSVMERSDTVGTAKELFDGLSPGENEDAVSASEEESEAP